MSTVQRVNFEPLSDLMLIQRRDFPVADASLVNPLNSLALVDGEWVTLNDAVQLVRATTIGTPGNLAAKMAYPLFTERGRTDVQGMGSKKMTVFFLNQWEAETRIFDAASTAGGAAISQVGQGLCVATITLGNRNYSGLVGCALNGQGNNLIVGHVTRLPSTNGGKLRFVSGGAGRNGGS